jgi:hypothetical protein
MPYEGNSGDEYYDKVTLKLDRRCAEDLYYALLLALGGQDYGDSGGKNGKTGSYSYEPPTGGYPTASY